MIKADYNGIIESYLAIESDIMEVDSTTYLPAMEAEGDITQGSTVPSTGAKVAVTGTTATGKKADEINASAAARNTVRDNEQSSADKTLKFQKALEAVKSFIKKILGIIDNVKQWLQNRLRTLMANDRSFSNTYQKQKRLVKPQDNVVVINYAYDNNKLERPYQALMKDVESTLETLSLLNPSNSSQRVTDIIKAPQGQMLKVLFEPYCKDSDTEITSAPAFVKYLVASYRSDKRERNYEAKDIPAIERNAMNTEEIRNRCSLYINNCTRIYSKIRNLEREMIPSADEKTVSLIRENARKAAILYNTYNSLIHSYFELRLEQAMNYRIILKKFYSF